MQFTINYYDKEGDVQYLKPFRLTNKCPNIHYLWSLLKYKNMHGYYIVDDYLLAWFHENLIGECGKKSSDLEKGGNYSGLWKFKNILCNGVLTKLVNKATTLPHGWVWIKSPNNPQMNILKFLYTDENFYKIDKNYTSKDITYVFYNERNQKICEIKELESKEPFREAIAEALGLKADNKNLRKIINKSIRQSKKNFSKIPAVKIDGLVTNQMYVQKKTSGINFIRKTKTTEEFWDVYLKKEGIPNKVFDIEGYRLFCTGFPRPFIPLTIDNNNWVRVFDSIPHRYDTQIYDLWILQSDLKEFYKYIINVGKGIDLVECLGLKDDNRVRASNKRQFDYPTYITTNNSIKNLEKDTIEEESEEEWEKEEVFERIDQESKIMSNKLKREQSEEKKQLKEDIENAINNNKNIINLKRDLQGINERYNTISNRNNKIKKYITAWESKKLSKREKSYFHIWWFLSFGQNFFTYYRGDVVGGGGNKSAFYNKETAKYLAKGDMEFIFKDQNLRECLNRFQSLVSSINNTLKLYENKQVAEKVGFDDLSRKQKNKARKNQLFNNKDTLKNEHAYKELGSVMSDSKTDVDNYINTSSLFSGSYADALKLLKNLPNIKACCIKIVKELKKIVEENDREIEFYLNNINQIDNNITIQKEIIKNSYKY